MFSWRGALSPPEGQQGCSQGVMLKVFPDGREITKLSQDVTGTGWRGGRQLRRGMTQKVKEERYERRNKKQRR